MIKKVKELKDVIANATNEILAIQEQCIHLNTRMGIHKWAPGHTNDARICYDCDKVVEIKQFTSPVIFTQPPKQKPPKLQRMT